MEMKLPAFVYYALMGMVALIVQSCSFVVTDPRPPAVATATNVARATETAAVAANGEPLTTATATLQAVEVITETQPTATGACTIKGNVNGQSKIYHLPGQATYNETKINEAAGDRWFCTEDQAVGAGFRKALR